MTVYKIPEANLHTLYVELGKLAKRAEKLGLPAITHTEVGEEFVGTDDVTRYVLVDVTGGTPTLEGWTLVGVIAHELNESTGLTENIIRALPFAGIDVPESYRTADPLNCDHCHTRRRRIDTYIVHSATEGFKQVGSSCLVDFTGSKDAQAVAKFLESLEDALIEGQSDEGDAVGGSGESKYIALISLVANAYAVLREYEYISRKVESLTGQTSTVARTWDNIFSKPEDKSHIRLIAEDSAKARELVEWVRANVTDTNDYLHNVRVAFMNDYTRRKNGGIVVSAIPLKDREIQKAYERARQPVSEWQGVVGQKIAFTVAVTRDTPKDNDYSPEPTHIYNMIDEKGNRFTWFSSRDVLKVGEIYTLTGTVKAHDEWKGTKSTVVTRCKIERTA